MGITLTTVEYMTQSRAFGAAAVTGNCAAGLVLYVKRTATGSNHGRSWVDAYRTVQDALADPCLQEGGEIWVAAGVYYPDEGANQQDNARTATFYFKKGVALYGGFAGDEATREMRDWQKNPTVLSGDLEQNDGTDTTGLVISPDSIAGINAYHVVTIQAIAATLRLDGFLITGGKAEDHSDVACTVQCGGGIFSLGATATFANLTLSGNRAKQGGGLYNGSSSVTLTNVAVVNNNASAQGGGIFNENSTITFTTGLVAHNNGPMGGGIYTVRGKQSLSAVTLRDNVASQGGAMFNSGNNYTLVHVSIAGNQATHGGGLYNNVTVAQIMNVTISGNRGLNGGGVYNRSSTVTLFNAIVTGNLATSGGGIFNNNDTPLIMTNSTMSGNRALDSGGAFYNRRSNPALTNVILWGNKAATGATIFNENESLPTIRYSLVEGSLANGQWNNTVGFDGGHNLDRDPLFMGTPDATAAPTTAYNVHLNPGSPAVNAGLNDGLPLPIMTDAAGNPRIADHTVDLGAYEEADPLPTPTPILTLTSTPTATQTAQPIVTSVATDRLPTPITTAAVTPIVAATELSAQPTETPTATPTETLTPLPAATANVMATALPTTELTTQATVVPTGLPVESMPTPAIAVTIDRHDTSPTTAGVVVSHHVTVMNIGYVPVTLNAVQGAAKLVNSAQDSSSDCTTPSTLDQGAVYTCMIRWQMPDLPDGVVEYEVTAYGQDASSQLVIAHASTMIPVTNPTALSTIRYLYLPIVHR